MFSCLVALMQDFIRWPSTLAETTETSLSFVEIILFQRIIGAIDGCHIQIKDPKQRQQAYYNR